MSKPLSSAPSDGTDETIRILHRITSLAEWQAPADSGPPHMTIAVLDLETEGLDPQYHQVLELAVALIMIDADGRVLSIDGPYTRLRDPGRPIEKHIAKITGITDAMVAGQAMDSERIAAFLGRAQACLSFNARFDRQHLEQLVPQVGEMPWVCAMADVQWLDLGFDGRAQGYLLAQAGLFNPVQHRASDDVESLVNLLARELSDGRTVMGHALEGAQAPSWRFEATDLPYRFRQDIFRRGYSWAHKHSLRHKLVRADDYEAELAWYCDLVGREPSIVPVDWVERYRSDWTWNPAKRDVEVVSWRR